MRSFYTEFESLLFFLSTAKTRILCNRQACFSVALKQDPCLVTHFPCYSDQTPNPEQNMRIGMNSTLVVGALACAAEVHHRSYPHQKSYRGTSLIRHHAPLGPYTWTMPRGAMGWGSFLCARYPCRQTRRTPRTKSTSNTSRVSGSTFGVQG